MNRLLPFMLFLIAIGIAVAVSLWPMLHEDRGAPAAEEALERADVRPAALREPVAAEVPGGAVSPIEVGPQRAPGAKPRASSGSLVQGLDGRKLFQPEGATVEFRLFAPGERNEKGYPSGVLPDGSYVYYNIPTTVTRNGHAVESLNTVVVNPLTGSREVTPFEGTLPRTEVPAGAHERR